MELRIRTTLVIEADSEPEGAALVSSVLDDINTYLSDDFRVELSSGRTEIVLGEG